MEIVFLIEKNQKNNKKILKNLFDYKILMNKIKIILYINRNIEELENENNYDLRNIPVTSRNTYGFVLDCKFINFFYKDICFHSFILVNNDNCVLEHSNSFLSDNNTKKRNIIDHWEII